MKTADFLTRVKEIKHKETLRRLELVLKNFEAFDRQLPFIVRKIGDGNFEVLNGNHRAMAYIEKKYTTVPALILNV